MSKLKTPKKITNLPKELKQLTVDTKNYKEKTSSTEILRKLRYGII